MRLVILGDSHTKALSDALAAAPPRTDIEIACKPVCSGTAFRQPIHDVAPDGVRFLDPVYRKRLAILSGSQHFVASPDMCYGLMMGFHTAGIYRHPSWATYAPSELAPKLGLRAVSSQVIGAIGLDRQRNVLAFFDALRAVGVNFFAISAPPPRRSHPCLRQGISPATLLTVDRLARQACRDRLQQAGIPILSPPEETVDPDGFLLPSYEQKEKGDYHHANAAYGAIMLRKAVALC